MRAQDFAQRAFRRAGTVGEPGEFAGAPRAGWASEDRDFEEFDDRRAGSLVRIGRRRRKRDRRDPAVLPMRGLDPSDRPEPLCRLDREQTDIVNFHESPGLDENPPERRGSGLDAATNGLRKRFEIDTNKPVLDDPSGRVTEKDLAGVVVPLSGRTNLAENVHRDGPPDMPLHGDRHVRPMVQKPSPWLRDGLRRQGCDGSQVG